MLCERCGQEDESVELIANPYSLEMYGEESLEYLCQDCYNDLRLSV